MNTLDYQTGYIPNQLFKVETFGNTFKLINTAGEKVGTMGIPTGTRKKAYQNGNALQKYVTETGKTTFRQVEMEKYKNLIAPMNSSNGTVQHEEEQSHEEVKKFIHESSVEMKPRELVMSDLKWKYLIRSAVRAKNILMVGPSGCGKTMAAKSLVRGLKRPDFYFNLGATQDPRATLIGNTHFSKDKGTFFAESLFVKAIKTPYAVILLDELSRAHPDAWNILMTVLDNGQRYLRLDEADGSPTVEVAKGVTFIATANIGNEYTSTRVMDRAIRDRFTTIEMDVLTDKKELDLLKYMYPDVGEYELKAVAETAHHTRLQSMSDEGKVSSMISTRASVEMASLLYDGFDLMEAAEISILPFFSSDGGVDSERTYVTQFLQKYIKNKETPEELYEEPVVEEDDNDIPTF